MNKQLPIALTCLTAVSSVLSFPTQSMAQSQKYYCAIQNGVPTTLVDKVGSQDVAIIRWTRAWSEQYTPQRRCEIVSERFQRASEQGNLNYLTTGFFNGLPVVCGTSQRGGSCDIVLLTLREGDDSVKTVEQLLGIGSYASVALEQSTGMERTYYDFNQAFDLD